LVLYAHLWCHRFGVFITSFRNGNHTKGRSPTFPDRTDPGSFVDDNPKSCPDVRRL
jgi:hypothetical protein